MAKDLFASAAKTSTAKAAAKDKEEINVSLLKDEKGNFKYPQAGQLILDYQKYHAQKAEAEAMLKTKGEQLKEIGLDLWTEKFEKDGKRPESFKMIGTVEKEVEGSKEKVTETGTLMFISSDSYKKVDELTAEILETSFGCIERTETFYFNNDLLVKYRDVISKALMQSKLISPEDKENLILKTETVSIKKGTIENVNLIASITGKPEQPEPVEGKEAVKVLDKFENVRDLVNRTEPTFSLKNC